MLHVGTEIDCSLYDIIIHFTNNVVFVYFNDLLKKNYLCFDPSIAKKLQLLRQCCRMKMTLIIRESVQNIASPFKF